MRRVAIKSAEQQPKAILLSLHDLLVRQRTQLINALRGHCSEFGLVAAQGTHEVAGLLAKLADTRAGRAALALLGRQIEHLNGEIAAVDAPLLAQHKANPVSRLLAEIPGVGPIGAITFALKVDPAQFQSGRHFAAWLGLTPREHSSGGKQRMGGISRAGYERCGNCWCGGPPRWCSTPNPAARARRPGC